MVRLLRDSADIAFRAFGSLGAPSAASRQATIAGHQANQHVKPRGKDPGCKFGKFTMEVAGSTG